MADLQKFDGLGLSTYLIRKLQKKGISTRYELLITSNAEIMEITGLTEAAILELKEKLGNDYFHLQQNNLNNWKAYTKIYNTGIEKLDIVLSKTPLKTGSVWEICGKSGVGKTQLCHTIAFNFAVQPQGTVLYIDTKCDFSGTRIMEMLRCRHVANNICGRIMQDILVERTGTAEGLCAILKKLDLQLNAGADADGGKIKLVIIDALPAVFFTYRSEADCLKGKYLLAKLNNLVYQLSKEHHIAFIYVNLLVNIEEEQQINEDLGNEEMSEPFEMIVAPLNPAGCVGMRPALGEYWNRAPHLRLSLETPIDNTSITNERILRVTRSCYTAVGATCNLHITTAGVS